MTTSEAGNSPSSIATLIAGDNHLINAVLDAEDLEATPIEPGDCLDSRGDTVNV
jgi:hypothetical protein